MRTSILCLCSLLFLALFNSAALAHRVYVYAFIDGSEIQVEAAFSRSQKVRHGKILVTDQATGALLREGATDEQGLFRFAPPSEFLQSGHDMLIKVLAGEGHQSDWSISAEELKALSPPDAAARPRRDASGQGRSPQPAAGPNSAEASPEPAPRQISSQSAEHKPGYPQLGEQELEQLLGKVVDARLAPLKHMLAQQQDTSPGLRDIIGGLGWILGLLGLAAYMKYRPRP